MATPPSSKCWRIIATDDNTSKLSALAETLRAAGHCVFAAYDGESALHFDLRGSTSRSAPELRDLRAQRSGIPAQLAQPGDAHGITTVRSMYKQQEEHSMTATITTPTAVKISGQAELQYSKRETIDVPGREGHLLALGEVRGTNQNTSATDFFVDAPALNVETADLIQGNGSHQGYYTMRSGGDAVTAKWHGTVTTVLGPNQQPQTSFQGTWEYTQGSGRYSEIQGSGVYEGEFLAQDRYLVRWQGERRQ